ncbi:MAG: [FeFe] hydrogenase H-cluster maturation GTPase HydF [Ruminococcaceae bacterium]|nr:[FeFe] hydrogenase H-cluster maturation GTPase HydF [Oscillospiraceae bacterium]
MGLNETPSSERVHIGFFGVRNAGKSSLVNAVTGQKLSVVSDVLGTTTDPVKKAMELLPIGPVVIIDTAGLDDEGNLGLMRVEKTKEVMAKTDIAVIVCDAEKDIGKYEKELIKLFEDKKTPYIVALNKSDLVAEKRKTLENEIYVSAANGENIYELKEKIASFAKDKNVKKPIVSDIVKKGEICILVTPIDESAPKGRLILPQQMVMRDLLDAHTAFVTCQPEELTAVLSALADKPKLVITDSQVFAKVEKDTPKGVMLTSFSILMARFKGDLEELIKGAAVLSSLENGDKVLISEGCTHHRQCNDIGTVKMPGWIKNFSKNAPEFAFTSGGEFPDKEKLSEYKVVVHCGGCMLNEAEMKNRTKLCKDAGVPIVNYGIAIAHMNGILKRSLEPFSEFQNII